MVLSTIYVVRHGYRSNWVVDTTTGEYHSNFPSPTGIASDPALASYGVRQAQQLASHLINVDPPVDLVYSSPFYRCLQTLSPFADLLVEQSSKSTTKQSSSREVRVNVEPGLGEFYGLARFDHPSPATIAVLNTHFPHLHAEKDPVIVPSTCGESITQLHDRIAYCLHHLIKRADEDPSGPKSLLICTHAAAMIAIGRALTGNMPEDEGTDDFQCFTCSFSKFTRRESKPKGEAEVGRWSAEKPDEVPDIGWRKVGVAGGWDCVVNADCSFLENGAERGWKFSGDESFLKDPNAFNDQKNKTAENTSSNTDTGSGSRL